MATEPLNLPLIVIVGPTASGKTALAVRLAREFNGEIISADSRAIYRGLSIGTAKPSIEERQGIQHWGIDLVEPGDRFTVFDFQTYAKQKIDDIRSRGSVPFLVGGTGLYIDSVVYNFEFPVVNGGIERRDKLSRLSVPQLHDYCRENNIDLPQNVQNKRHLVNVILREGATLKRSHKLDPNIIVVGITTEKNILNERISQRAQTIFDQEIILEAAKAAEEYGWENEAMTGNVYPLTKLYLEGEITKEQMIERFTVADRKLAKRQLTWLRRSEHTMWLSLDDAYKYVAQRLSE